MYIKKSSLHKSEKKEKNFSQNGQTLYKVFPLWNTSPNLHPLLGLETRTPNNSIFFVCFFFPFVLLFYVTSTYFQSKTISSTSFIALFHNILIGRNGDVKDPFFVFFYCEQKKKHLHFTGVIVFC